MGLANIDVLLGLSPRFNLSHVINGECSLEETIIEGPSGYKPEFLEPKAPSATYEAMWRAIDHQEPFYDHVLAHIPSLEAWKSYPRLGLPMRGGLAIFAVETSDIDIPFLPAAA